MSNRQLIRPNLSEIRKETAESPRRKAAPPEGTAAEAYYYLKQMSTSTPMVVVLNDGERLEGTIEWYDRMCIKLNRENAPDLLLMKHAVRYMHKHEDFEEKDPLEPQDSGKKVAPVKRPRKTKS
jgi:host factor-I protein